MKLITAVEIDQMERLQRINLVNAITGYKPANLIGTINESGQTNLAIFSSVVHLGSAPPVIGMVSRPDVVDRHTLNNIRNSGVYTINHIRAQDYRKAHYTSAKFPGHISEFDACGFTPNFIDGFTAPFVKESPAQMGLQLEQTIDLPNGTVLIIGSIQFIRMKEEAFDQPSGDIDYSLLESICLTGLDTYYQTSKIEKLPYARVSELPDDLVQSTDPV